MKEMIMMLISLMFIIIISLFVLFFHIGGQYRVDKFRSNIIDSGCEISETRIDGNKDIILVECGIGDGDLGE